MKGIGIDILAFCEVCSRIPAGKLEFSVFILWHCMSQKSNDREINECYNGENRGGKLHAGFLIIHGKMFVIFRKRRLSS